MTSTTDTAVPWIEQLESTLESFDEAGGHRVLSRAFEQLGVEDALIDVVMPYLRHLGCRWENGHIGVAQEHFASNVIRSRLSVLLHAQRGATGPLVVLACMPGERHEFGLLAMALTLARLGAQVAYLGANTPTPELVRSARTLGPRAVVLSANRRTAFAAHATALRRVGGLSTVHIAGPGATAEVAGLCEAQLVTGDPVEGARALYETLSDGRTLVATGAVAPQPVADEVG
ncbi:MAG: ycgE 1 [Humibacillus sp.]|nr:ycgE 1 [Humibacillus sp.]